MLHLIVLLLCHLSYIQLGKLDHTIPHPKPHLTVQCFMKLLAYIPFNVGLQLSYFQNVTKLIRDLLVFFYIIGQYYTFDYDLIYKLMGFEFFAIFAMPLILEGWMANNPNYILYLVKYYSLYVPLFFNQFLLHDDRMLQTIFFFALIEIPSMAHKRTDKDLPQIRMNSYIFKVVQLPRDKLAILHCIKKNSNDINQIELALAYIKFPTKRRRLSVLVPEENEWILTKCIAVSPNTSDLNYVERSHTIVISSCSDIKIYNAQNLQLLKVIQSNRSFKRLSFIKQERYFSTLKKVNNQQTIISINDFHFNSLISQHVIPQDIQPEIIKFIKYSYHHNDHYVYMCVPSDRLNSLILIDFTNNLLNNNNNTSLDTPIQQSPMNSQQTIQSSFHKKLQHIPDNGEEDEEEQLQNIPQVDKDKWREYFNSCFSFLKKGISECPQEINMYEYLKSAKIVSSFLEEKQQQHKETSVKEYVLDVSAIKDILVHEHLLIVSCSENIVFFDLHQRKIVKKISTLSFDTCIHWVRVTQNYTYYLLSNEIKAWIAKQHNFTHQISFIQHYNFYGIQYILENTTKLCLYIIYNNTLYKQKIAVIDLSSFE